MNGFAIAPMQMADGLGETERFVYRAQARGATGLLGAFLGKVATTSLIEIARHAGQIDYSSVQDKPPIYILR